MRLNLIPVTPSRALPVLRACHQLGESVMLHGEPGVGKTSLARQVAAELGGPCETFLLTQIEPCDLRGLPDLDHERQVTRWFAPEFLPRRPGPGVVLLDELNAAEPRLQKSAYQLLLDRRVGEYRLPDGWLVVATGNTGSDGALVHQIDAPCADRMVHLLVTPSVDDWIAWAQQAGVPTQVIAYLRLHPEHLNGAQDRVQHRTLLAPSPRGWARVGRFVALGLPDDALELAVAGIVGDAVAASFMSVWRELETATAVEDLCRARDEERPRLLPRTVAGLYHLAYGLAAWASDLPRLTAALHVAARLPADLPEPGLPVREVQTLAMELLLQRAERLGALLHVVALPDYLAYSAERAAAGLEAPLPQPPDRPRRRRPAALTGR